MALVTGQKTSIGTSAVQLTATSTKAVRGVEVKALAGNGAIVYVGDSGVTSSNGFQLSAGESVFIETVHGDVADPSLIYVIAASGSQGVCFVVR